MLIHWVNKNNTGLRTELETVAHSQLNTYLTDTLLGLGNHQRNWEKLCKKDSFKSQQKDLFYKPGGFWFLILTISLLWEIWDNEERFIRFSRKKKTDNLPYSPLPSWVTFLEQWEILSSCNHSAVIF